jgi:hypothetical protein
MLTALLSLALLAAPAHETRTSSASDELPFNDAQLDYLEKMRDEIREEVSAGAASATPAAPQGPQLLELRADAYIKWLYRNNTTQGCVTYGNPHPRGDNYSGDNGQCPELGLTLIGHPTSKIEAGARIQSRYGLDFADWYENGDKTAVPDGSGESLGNNHAAPLQLRGLYVRIADPLPLIDWFLVGSSDLSYWDPWTVGKVRYIDRFNAKGLFLKTSIGSWADVLIARIAMSKLFGTANYNVLEEDLVTNPFWANNAIYAANITTKPALFDGLTFVFNGAISLDQQADVRDPDAPGSTNTVDKPDGVTSTDSRFLGANASFTVNFTRSEFIKVRAVAAASHNRPNMRYVTNLALGGLGFSNIVYDKVTDLAGTVRVEIPDLLGKGRTLQLEYFNIGANYNAVAGSRREADVLLTDGFFGGGQLPTLNLANELIDFSDVFYESCVGWHGATALLTQEADLLDLGLEGTFIGYNTDLQNRNMDVYPGFGGFTGYTDTDLFSYANTNDRGTDPRTVYHKNQSRHTLIVMARGALKPNLWPGARIDLKLKFIRDIDLRDTTTDKDDYRGSIFVGNVSVGAQPLDRLAMALGVKGDYWIEDGRSGSYAGGVPDFLNYTTTKIKPYIEFKYSLGVLSASYHLEALKKTVSVSDPNAVATNLPNFTSGIIWRSIGYLSTTF